jgi:hypothetical protein
MEFEVMVKVPEDFQFYGRVPYDMEICAGTAFVKVEAETIEEATAKANQYFAGEYEE